MNNKHQDAAIQVISVPAPLCSALYQHKVIFRYLHSVFSSVVLYTRAGLNKSDMEKERKLTGLWPQRGLVVLYNIVI